MTAAPRRVRMPRAALIALAALALASCSSGGDMKARPEFRGDVESIRHGSVGTAGNVSVGVSGVWADSARLELADGTSNARLKIAVGDVGTALGISVRLCATWVDESPSDMPGGDDSRVYLVYGTEGEVPACPERIADGD